jgi:hypothetical protein
MTPSVQIGTILIGEESPRMAEVLALESEPYCENWNMVKAHDGFTLDDRIHAAGWNFFFLSGSEGDVLRCDWLRIQDVNPGRTRRHFSDGCEHV